MKSTKLNFPGSSAAVLLLGLLSVFLLCSCCNCPKGGGVTVEPAKMEQVSVMNESSIRKPVIVYKTRADYSNYVPVILSEDKSVIVSYPSLRDVFYENRLATPTKLQDGYLLDNRGITVNSGFLDMTYTEFSELSDTPSPVELKKRLLDRDPFLEIWLCGDRDAMKDPVAELNKLISSGFPGCKRLK